MATIVLRGEKGTPLTITEVDANFENLDTALIEGTGVTESYVSSVSVGGTTFDQGAIEGEINSDLLITRISYAGATGITVTSLSSGSAYVYIDSSGNLQQQTTTPTREDWSRKIFTMRIGIDVVAGTILGFEYLNNPIRHFANSTRDLFSYLISQGVPFKKEQIITGRAGDLGFDVSAGSFMEFGGTGDIHNPNIRELPAVANTSYTLFSRTAVVSTETDLVKFYDNNGTITPLGSTTVVGHRLYRFSNGNFVIQYGQGNYANMTLAKSGALVEEYVLNPQLKNSTFFGWWFIESTATNTGGTTLTDFKEYTIGIQGGSSSGLAGCLLKGNNLSDLLDPVAARGNLSLGNVDNTSDANKPVSTATQTELDDRPLKSNNGSDFLDPVAVRTNLGITSPSLSRNAVQNQDPVSQGTATRSGMSSTIYTGNASTQSVATGVDMDTGDFGGLVWVKERSSTSGHLLFDTTRGATNFLASQANTAEGTDATSLTSFDSTGFSVGANAGVNQNTETYVAWSWQTTEKSTFNFLRYSQEFNNAIWTKTASTVVTGGKLAPDGSLSAFEIDDTSTSGDDTLIQSFSAQDLVYTISYYIKRGTSDQCSISLTSPNFAFKTVGFNFDTETLSGSSVADAGFTDEGNGWYRLSLKMSSSSGLGNVETRIYPTDSDLASTRTGSVLVWGAQVVEGSNPKAYVQTVDSQGATTNRGKPYTCHYNAALGFSIVGYEGDGVDGHEIPHFLGKEPELSISKKREGANGWLVQSPLFAIADYLLLETTGSLTNNGTVDTIFSNTTSTLGNNVTYNASTKNIIQYNFTSIPNVCKIGTHIGAGATGNYVPCGFKVGWVLIKNLTTAGSWHIYDGSRGVSNLLVADSSIAELTSRTEIEFVDDGFVLTNPASGSTNALNNQYIFMAYAEGTAFDGGKTLTNYPYATTDEVLTINSGTLMSFAEGFNANGQVDTQELVGAGVTLSFGTGYENQTRYIYKDKAGVYNSTQYRPLEGISRAQADKFGVVSPLNAATRTTDKHFGYESATGVVIEHGNDGTGFGYQAFSKTVSIAATSGYHSYRWRTTSTTTSYLGYKYNEPRVLKSWRFQENVQSRSPKRFTIEGSNGGFVWTAIDSTYTASDYTGDGDLLWGDIQDTSANTAAYEYYRINITANNGDANQTVINELEFNTVTPSDYYNVVDGLVRNNAGTVIDRIYLAKIMTGASGELLNYENLPVAKIKGVDAELQGDLVVHGKISNGGVATARVSADSRVSPTSITGQYNVYDVLDTGTGRGTVFFETPMDSIDYVVVSSTFHSQANRLIPTIYNKTLISFDYSLVYDSSVYGNLGVELIVFGGKKIL